MEFSQITTKIANIQTRERRQPPRELQCFLSTVANRAIARLRLSQRDQPENAGPVNPDGQLKPGNLCQPPNSNSSLRKDERFFLWGPLP